MYSLSSILPILEQNNDSVARLEQYTQEALNSSTDLRKWSPLQCIEHLNAYAQYYNPALDLAIKKQKQQRANGNYQHSWIGKKSIQAIHPDNAKKSKTYRRMRPGTSGLSLEVLQQFKNSQSVLHKIVQQAETIDLNKKAVPIEFFKLLQLQIGECIEWLVLHQRRHLNQAEAMLKSTKVTQVVP